jgi:hypothetical protein
MSQTPRFNLDRDLSKQHPEHLEGYVQTMLDCAVARACDDKDAITNPGYGVYCMIVDQMADYCEQQGDQPTTIYLTRRLETMLDHYLQQEGYDIRKEPKFLGTTIVRNADHYKLV